MPARTQQYRWWHGHAASLSGPARSRQAPRPSQPRTGSSGQNSGHGRRSWRQRHGWACRWAPTKLCMQTTHCHGGRGPVPLLLTVSAPSRGGVSCRSGTWAPHLLTYSVPGQASALSQKLDDLEALLPNMPINLELLKASDWVRSDQRVARMVWPRLMERLQTENPSESVVCMGTRTLLSATPVVCAK